MRFDFAHFIDIFSAIVLVFILVIALSFVTADNKIENYYIRTVPNQTEIIYHVVADVYWRKDHCAFSTKDFKEAKAQYEYLLSTLPKKGSK